MTITLTREQQEQIEAEVAAGRFASVEEAVRIAVAHFFMPVDTSDLSWAKPYLDEARASFARDGGIPAEEVFKETDAWLRQRSG